jgi:hypothetical protein
LTGKIDEDNFSVLKSDHELKDNKQVRSGSR